MGRKARVGSTPIPGTMKKIDKEKFISICNDSVTMTEAARKLNMHFGTFKRYAIKFNCYNTNFMFELSCSN